MSITTQKPNLNPIWSLLYVYILNMIVSQKDNPRTRVFINTGILLQTHLLLGWAATIDLYTMTAESPSLFIRTMPAVSTMDPQLVILDTGFQILLSFMALTA